MIYARRFSFAAALVLAAAVALAAPAARAQSQNTDLTTPLITNSARVATGAAITSTTQTNIDKRGVLCTWATTASSGSTSSTFGIQQYDTATNTWQTIKTSAAIIGGAPATDAVNTPHTLAVYPGVAVSSLGTNNEAQSAVLPRAWRVTETISVGAGSSSPTITSKIGCNYIK